MELSVTTNPPGALVLGFGVAAVAGALVGLEREPRGQASGSVFAGIRTFTLFSLFGALCSLLALGWGWAIPALGLGALAVLLGLAYRSGQQRLGGPDAPGLTSEAAALVVFLLGTLPFAEATGLDFLTRLLTTLAGGAIVTGILALRSPLHRFARAVESADMQATVQFLLLAVVALPLVPDSPMGPYGALNPHGVTLVIVLVAGISFVGYVAVRWLGPRRGIGLVGLFGGLVSSTAVTLTFSSRGRDSPALAPACAMAIVVASTVMFPRVLGEIAVLDAPLVGAAAPALLAMLGVGLGSSGLLWMQQRGSQTDGQDMPRFANPFQLSQALKMGALFAGVVLVAAAARDHLGNAGLYLSSAVAGLTDVDAIALSVAKMHASGELPETVAVRSIVLATIVNTLVKAGLALVLGGRGVGRPVGLALGGVAVVGGAVVMLTT